MTFPRSVEEVSKIAALCNDNEIPLIPFGSGTGLEGGINAVKVCIADVLHCRKEIHSKKVS